ncbi:hypothetical protein CC86DRAFT_433211 [Ophiobolus disseminans]|uniref:F-box domain-containing protein n=1 Tax=Ophiobolus disseminans TaxID=1469910 RepID=A0A6A6ZEH3_9PLEO|nr:hypothetical protein CC86DRAFT_433211 [Ophiobolus disseminans]
MPLHKLSTELDVIVVGYLDPSAIEPMTHVSKYYRELAEPRLYRHVCFAATQGRRITQFLLTLLERPDLRPQVESIELYSHSNDQPPPMSILQTHPGDPSGVSLYHRLTSQQATIRSVILTTLAHTSSTPENRTHFFLRVFDPFPYFDGALAIVVCLANKVKMVRLTLSPGHHLPTTRHMLNLDWTISHGGRPDCPLQDLELYELRNDTGRHFNFNAAISPSMRCLKLEGYRSIRQLLTPRSAPPTIRPLTHIKLIHVNLDPQILRDAIRSPWFAGLEVLWVQVIGDLSVAPNQPRPWETFDYRKLETTMAAYLPKLHTFCWVGTIIRSGQTPTPFGTFSQLEKLKTLFLDYKLFLANGVLYELPSKAYLEGFFPKGLSDFDLCGLNWVLVRYIHSRFLGGIENRENKLYEFAQFVSRLPVKRITIVVNMYDWPHDKMSCGPFAIQDAALDTLRKIADMLHPLDTTLSVVYLIGLGDTLRPLVAPGFTAEEIFYDKYLIELKARGIEFNTDVNGIPTII